MNLAPLCKLMKIVNKASDGYIPPQSVVGTFNMARYCKSMYQLFLLLKVLTIHAQLTHLPSLQHYKHWDTW